MSPSAWISIVAVTLSFGSLIVAWRALRNGKRSADASELSAQTALRAVTGAEAERTSENERRDRSQASLIWAWVRYEGSVTTSNRTDLTHMRRCMEIMNASTEPVFDVVVLDPNVGTPRPIGVLLPSSDARRVTIDDVVPDKSIIHEQTPIRIEFRDSKGRRWVREPYESVKLVGD